MLFFTSFVKLVQRMSYQGSLEVFGELKKQGRIINTVRHADDLVLLGNEETVLQDMID
jgi:hypothetical protein